MLLKDLVENFNLEVYGFATLKGLDKYCNKDGTKAVLSSLNPSIMLDMGIKRYFAPQLPRYVIFDSPEKILNSGIIVNYVKVSEAYWDNDKVVIVSRHKGTVNILRKEFPTADVLESINPEDITGKYVIGTLPPDLIQYAEGYVGISIRDFDYTKDKDLVGKQLMNRIIIGKPIKVEVREI